MDRSYLKQDILIFAESCSLKMAEGTHNSKLFQVELLSIQIIL
jgi:hypothetical protein